MGNNYNLNYTYRILVNPLKETYHDIVKEIKQLVDHWGIILIFIPIGTTKKLKEVIQTEQAGESGKESERQRPWKKIMRLNKGQDLKR